MYNKLTLDFSTLTLGLAEGYSNNIIFIDTPINIPSSTPMSKHKTNVTNAGIKSFLLDFHMGFNTSYSIMKITAHMMTAASDALGM